VLDAGWIGVQVFFVLSGFLISSILLREKARPLKAYLQRFYWRRTLRIFPLYYAYLLALLCASLAMPERLFAPERLVLDKYVISLFSYTYNFICVAVDYEHSFFFTHFWSLAVEEQFYLIWPLLVHRLPSQWFHRLLWCLILGGPLIRLLAHHGVAAATGHPELATAAAYLLTPCQLDAFAIGALLAVAEQRGADGPSWLPWAGLGAFAATAVVHASILGRAGLGAATAFGFPTHMPWNGQYAWGYTVLNIASASLVALALRAPALGRAVDRWGLGHLGRRSYAIYIVHWPLAHLWGRFVAVHLGSSALAAFLLYLVVLLVVVELSWRLLEAPILRLKDRVGAGSA
jgi:peptidoglycan/LPS O-acetylase OafA/YrhL